MLPGSAPCSRRAPFRKISGLRRLCRRPGFENGLCLRRSRGSGFRRQRLLDSRAARRVAAIFSPGRSLNGPTEIDTGGLARPVADPPPLLALDPSAAAADGRLAAGPVRRRRPAVAGAL